ncbi:MAG: endonuclease/exonuclease/phosphatase family protein [Planctomycetota bacterium]|nr:endonuclease/exonuclease/phosphatase family protein [Planctomycetota bacterium]
MQIKYSSLLILACLLPPAVRPVAADELNVMTFNIRYDNLGDGLDNWRFRSANVAGMFSHHKVAVAGLQEVLHRQLSHLEKRLPGYAHVGVGREDGKQKGEYAPIFFDKDRLELTRSDTIWLSETPKKVGSKSWDSSLPRIATLAWLKDKKTGKMLLVVNTHFDHRGAVARRESAALIGRHVKQVNQEKIPVVVMGDLNCLPGSDPYRQFLQAGFQDALEKSEKEHQGPRSTWNGFGKTVVEGRRIDFIFISPDLRVLAHRIDARQFNGRFPSDHCPVISRLGRP